MSARSVSQRGQRMTGRLSIRYRAVRQRRCDRRGDQILYSNQQRRRSGSRELGGSFRTGCRADPRGEAGTRRGVSSITAVLPDSPRGPSPFHRSRAFLLASQTITATSARRHAPRFVSSDLRSEDTVAAIRPGEGCRGLSRDAGAAERRWQIRLARQWPSSSGTLDLSAEARSGSRAGADDKWRKRKSAG